MTFLIRSTVLFFWRHREKAYWTVGLITLSVLVSWASFHFHLRF